MYRYEFEIPGGIKLVIPGNMKVLFDYGEKTIEIISPTESSSSPGEEGRTSGGTCQSESTVSEQEKRDCPSGCESSKCETQGQGVEPLPLRLMSISGNHVRYSAKLYAYHSGKPLYELIPD